MSHDSIKPMGTGETSGATLAATCPFNQPPIINSLPLQTAIFLFGVKSCIDWRALWPFLGTKQKKPPAAGQRPLDVSLRSSKHLALLKCVPGRTVSFTTDQCPFLSAGEILSMHLIRQQIRRSNENVVGRNFEIRNLANRSLCTVHMHIFVFVVKC